MTPWQLANTSELSQQTALFCFAAKAEVRGFAQAKNPKSYNYKNTIIGPLLPVPELAWLHSVPNGVRSGDVKSRMIEGARLRGSGVKAGVLDTFWPLARGGFHGLYIEMKVGDNVLSPEQIAFRKYAESQSYCVNVCYSWVEASEVLEAYYNLGK